MKTLLLDGNPIEDDGIGEFPALITLRILHSKMTDKGVEKLAGLRTLQMLGIGGPGITEAGLETLGQMPKLAMLLVEDSNVRDLRPLLALKRLGTLSLKGNPIEDEAIVCLEGLTNLRTLGLGGTRVTDAGLWAFAT